MNINKIIKQLIELLDYLQFEVGLLKEENKKLKEQIKKMTSFINEINESIKKR